MDKRKYLLRKQGSSKKAISKRQYILFMALSSIIISSFYSCEKEVKFKLKPGSEKVVVEGSIENGMPPYILLTKSLDFFSKIDINVFEDAFLHDAVIYVSDGQQTVMLKEYQIKNQGINLYLYTIDSSDLQALNFKGTHGGIYDLRIEYKGGVYNSTTTIPTPKALDSIWAAAPLEGQMPENFPNSMLLYAQYTDPDTLGNRVRYFTKRNSEPFLTPFFSTYDDAIVNGTTVQIGISKGVNKADSFNRETSPYFYKGDTVIVKWSSIDKNVFDFWRTLEFSTTATGNPFAAPVEVSTNILGGALGVWAGYGSTYDTLVIPQ